MMVGFSSAPVGLCVGVCVCVCVCVCYPVVGFLKSDV